MREFSSAVRLPLPAPPRVDEARVKPRGGILGRWLRGRRKAVERPVVRLDDVRRRLELLLAAVYGRPIPIAPATPPPEPGAWDRLVRRRPPHLRPTEPVAASDAERIHLPRELDAGDGVEAALARYRLLAIEQAERLARGTAALAPPDDPLTRDLYLLAESAAVDRAIAATVPGIFPALAPERAAALAARPALEALTPAERGVEGLVRTLLAADPAAPPPDVAPGDTPHDSLAWARATAERMRAAGERYRGLPPVGAWGTVIAPPPVKGGKGAKKGLASDWQDPWAGTKGRGMKVAGSNEGDRESRTGPDVGASPNGKRTAGSGSPTKVEDAQGGADDTPPAAEAGDSVAEPSDEVASGGGGAPPPAAARREPVAEGEKEIVGIPYPEWDARMGGYRRPGATVRLWPANELEDGWAEAVLAAHPALVRRMREQFERLRARRTRLTQQREGDELDLAACVRALVDQRTGHTVDDRLYVAVRPARRELAILLLVDVSGSTSDHVTSAIRIIDVEKIALLLSSEAFDSLGDRYAIHTFSGRSAGNVRVRTIKDFAERNGEAVRRRISALQPEGYTRLGAAIRHASALLEREGATHQLLLILSDGKPNDEDEYAASHGVEDSRQAIAEARALGVYPFCITVDRAGSAYLKRIFGSSGHMILRQPEQLPQALLKLVRHLLAS